MQDKIKKPSKKELTTVIMAELGIVTRIAKHYDVSSSTIYRWINSAGMKEVLERARDMVVDIAEDELIKLIKNGNVAATIFTLKTLGKHRGYVERTEKNVTGGLDLKSHHSGSLSVNINRRVITTREELDKMQETVRNAILSTESEIKGETVVEKIENALLVINTKREKNDEE